MKINKKRLVLRNKNKEKKGLVFYETVWLEHEVILLWALGKTETGQAHAKPKRN